LTDRYPSIGDYGMLGDLRSAALLSRGGSIDWMCLPRFDSQAIFSRLLDWDHGGYFEVAPSDEAVIFRRYRSDSNVMETMWRTERRQLRLVDWMPVLLEKQDPKPPE
jgi:GH15 family glucan-1,4-alpha-glucosidase